MAETNKDTEKKVTTETEKMAVTDTQQPEDRTEEKDTEFCEKHGYVERKRWLFLGLPFTFTKYTLTEEMLTITEGLLSIKENDCYMYKVQDVELQASFMERIAGLGTVVCHTGDTTHPQLLLTHIKHAKEIKNYILKVSEEARRRRRTLNTLNIDADYVEEMGE